jgi:hypothetical protein
MPFAANSRDNMIHVKLATKIRCRTDPAENALEPVAAKGIVSKPN